MFRVVLLCLVVAVAGLFLPQSIYSETGVISGKVVWVADGDTITVYHDSKRTKIRFQAVDAPEIAHPEYPDHPATDSQPYGYSAKDFMFRKASGKNVKVVVDTIDKYGRSVGTIFLDDKTNLNEALVSSGLGWWYAKYSPDNTQMARLEAEARGKKMGLWKQEDPLPPWIFRHPELKDDWNANKCELDMDSSCEHREVETTCKVSTRSLAEPPLKKAVVFSSTANSVCSARKLLEYQLCRASRSSYTKKIVCKANQNK